MTFEIIRATFLEYTGGLRKSYEQKGRPKEEYQKIPRVFLDSYQTKPGMPVTKGLLPEEKYEEFYLETLKRLGELNG